MRKSKNLTEEDLQKILQKNPKIKIAKDTNKTAKISLDNINNEKKIALINKEVETPKKKKGGTTTYQINKINKSASYECTFSEDHFSILFKDARLLAINEIFAILQVPKRKFEVFNYKKNWHEIVSKILYEQKILHKDKIPYFDFPVEITVFRQAPRHVDKDAVSIMFKFIIDALKKNKKNPYGIIAEDNPKIVSNIIPKSEKGEYMVGIKIKKTPYKESVFLPEEILS